MCRPDRCPDCGAEDDRPSRLWVRGRDGHLCRIKDVLCWDCLDRQFTVLEKKVNDFVRADPSQLVKGVDHGEEGFEVN